jgi:DNA-binding response OmpR family regulator
MGALKLLNAEPETPSPPDVILVVDTDAGLGSQIVHHLDLDGYPAIQAQNANHARMVATQHPLAAVVLGNLEQPRSHLDVLEEIRHVAAPASSWDPAVPVLVVSQRTEELDLARAFEAGADDFMARPVPYVELRARLRAVLRRVHPGDTDPPSLRVGPLEIDASAHKVSLAGRPIELRRLEYDLLVQLASAPDRVFGKEELLRSVWGYRSRGATRTVETHAGRLRRKLNGDGSGRWVITVWGIGFRLK